MKVQLVQGSLWTRLRLVSDNQFCSSKVMCLVFAELPMEKPKVLDGRSRGILSFPFIKMNILMLYYSENSRLLILLSFTRGKAAPPKNQPPHVLKPTPPRLVSSAGFSLCSNKYAAISSAHPSLNLQSDPLSDILTQTDISKSRIP